MTMRLTFGIDPGLSGAIATLIDGEPGPVLDMPILTVGERNEVDARAMAKFIRDVRGQHPGAYFSACIERVRAMPVEGRKQGAQSSMNFGDNYGKAKAVLEVMGIPYTRAEPASWKRRFGLLGQGKDAARLLALQRFPAAGALLKRKKDDGRADALLIALYHDQADVGARAA